jgi:hypothetical protein
MVYFEEHDMKQPKFIATIYSRNYNRWFYYYHLAENRRRSGNFLPLVLRIIPTSFDQPAATLPPLSIFLFNSPIEEVQNSFMHQQLY